MNNVSVMRENENIFYKLKITVLNIHRMWTIKTEKCDLTLGVNCRVLMTCKKDLGSIFDVKTSNLISGKFKEVF